MKFARMLRSHKEVKTELKKDTEDIQGYILIVKENPVESSNLKRNLESLGYLIKDVSTGKSALEEINKKPPVLIIADVMLEGMNGNELCRIIKSNAKTSMIPFMFIASPESTPDKMLGFQGYGDDYITTPFDLNVLKQRVSALTRRQQKEKADEASIGEDAEAKIDDKSKVSSDRPSDDSRKKPKLIPVDDPLEQLSSGEEATDEAVSESTMESLEFNTRAFQVPPDMAGVQKEAVAKPKIKVSSKFNFPGIKEINEADSASLYSFGKQIFSELEEASGIFGPDEYLYLLNFSERMVERNIANNELLSLALGRGFGSDLFSHCINTAIITVRIGRNLKLKTEELALLFISGFLCDFGLLRVRSEILNKKGELSHSEREKVNKHIVFSIEMVENAIKESFPQESMYIASTIYQHHEREQGQGYPHGIAGDQINLSSKILGLADTYEALCHTRFHRLPQTTYRALQEVVSMKKTFFDPNVLRALVNELTFFPIGCYVRLNTDEVGLVIDTSSVHSMRPKVKILIDSDGDEVVGDKIVNLVEAPFLYVVKPLEDEDVPELITGEQ